PPHMGPVACASAQEVAKGGSRSVPQAGHALGAAAGNSHHMIDETLIASLGIAESEAEAMVREALGDQVALGDMEELLGEQIQDFAPGKLIRGKIIGFAGDYVVVEVGLKSEGLIDRGEFDTEPRIGESVDVLLESLEGEDGIIQLSKRKADR